MNEIEFKNKFRRIVFAILDDHNAHQSHNPQGNFLPFANVFTRFDVESDFNEWIERNDIPSRSLKSFWNHVESCKKWPSDPNTPGATWQRQISSGIDAKIGKTKHVIINRVKLADGSHPNLVFQDVNIYNSEGELLKIYRLSFDVPTGSMIDTWYVWPGDSK